MVTAAEIVERCPGWAQLQPAARLLAGGCISRFCLTKLAVSRPGPMDAPTAELLRKVERVLATATANWQASDEPMADDARLFLLTLIDQSDGAYAELTSRETPKAAG